MHIITSTEELEKIADELNNEEFITIDTEFHREKTFYPLLCLVQIAGTDNAYLIDPLANDMDLSSVKKLLINNKIVKVFHASFQDMEIIYYLFGVLPVSIFDTQIAAQIVGIGESVGYGKLVDDICGVTLDKSSRHTDWCKRPLTEKQKKYALSDVTYLRDIYTFLRNKVSELERDSWLEEETKKILDVKLYSNSPEDAWKKLKLNNSSGKYRSIVKDLAIWREEYAQEVNKPRAWVLKNDAIYEIASIVPKDEQSLKNLRFYKAGDEKINIKILGIVRAAIHKEYPEIVKTNRAKKSCSYLVDMLKILLKIQCDKHNIVPSVVVKSEELEILASSENMDLPVLQGWRYELFGKHALELKNGKIALTVIDGKIKLIGY